MRPAMPSPAVDADEEISALIQPLHQTGQRLEELTAGEVDTVADSDGRPFVLRHAQEQLRVSETAKQAAILNALPAHIVLLDIQGRITTVNDAWRRFADANALQSPAYAIGMNYLEVCDRARGDGESEAHQAAAGIRSVLAGAQKSFSLEYPCHSPAEQRWFLMTVTPLTDDHPNGVVVMHLNIIERKRAEEALRESEARFRALTAMSSDFYWESDAEHRLTARASASKKRSMVAVFQRGAQIGERRWEIPNLSPDAAGWQAHRDVLDAHLPFRDFELSRLGGNGTERHIAISGDPVFDASGTFLGYRGVGTDITERKQAERLVRDSEERFRAIFDQAPIAMALLDMQGHPIVSNSPLSKMVGYSNAELSQMKFSDFTYPEDVDNDVNQFTELLEGKIFAYSMEKRYVHKNGNPIWARLFVTMLRDKNGLPQDIIGMAEDITERKQAAEEIRFKNTMLQTLQETSLDAMLVVDENGHIISYNQQFIDLWRLSPQLVSARLDAPVLQSVADQVENSEAFVARVQYLHEHHDDKSRDEVSLRDGRIIDRYSAPVIGADRKYYGRVWYFRDITKRKHAAQELRESERRFRDLLGNVELVSMMLDREGRITYCNGYLLRLSGWRYEEVIGRNWFERFIPPEIADLKDSFFAALLANLPEARHHENEILTRSGERRLIRWNNSVLRSGAGDVIGTASIGEDITERKEAADRIVHLNRVHAVLSGINTLIVRVHDRDELFREACRIAVEAGGFRMALIAIVDKSATKIVPVASAGKDEALLSVIRGILSSSEHAPTTMTALALREKQAVVSNDSQRDPRVLFGVKYAEAGVRSMAVLPLLVSDEAVGVLALYASEIEFFHEDELKLLTELAGDIAFAIDHIDKQERLDYLAYYDVLTGLANRSLFLERVAQYVRSAVSGGHELAVFLIDLERFKNINDGLGRPAGDALLRQVAEWLTHNAGDASLLARIGADHFAMVLPQVRREGDVTRLLEKTMAAFLEHPFRLNDAVFRVSARVGAAVFPEDGADAETLLRNAEAALKKAKASGERYLFYTQKMTEAVAGKLTLENQLRQALDNEEFVLHYQPKVNLVSGKLTGAEALIRWNDPRTGLVPPGRFIPILEETGLIYDVGRWALHQAIADYLRWRAAGLPAVRIAVNVSPLQLRNRGFIAEIGHAIGIDAHAAAGLELEITESLIMADIKLSIASLQAIRALGVTIAIDDFGTGFSSLSYLAKLPVDTLKIDRSFVIEMTGGPEGLALVSTIINLAHSLKVKVVAEGVETEEQSRLLRVLSCDEMQGFLFSKAVPSEVFEAKFLLAPPAGGK